MIWIEFLGSVGSGKSSLAAALRERMQAGGTAVFSPQAAITARLEHSLRETSGGAIAMRAARKMAQIGWQASFSISHPKLIWQVMQAERALHHLPGWHRKIIRGLFFEVAGWYQCLAGGLDPKDAVLVEEGLAHRAVNLFAWRTESVDPLVLRAYLKNLPAVPLTICVHAPLSDCIERASGRGLPVRLRGKDPAEIDRFIRSSHSIASVAGDTLASLGRKVIEVDNSVALQQSASELYKAVIQSGLLRANPTKRIQAVEELTP